MTVSIHQSRRNQTKQQQQQQPGGSWCGSCANDSAGRPTGAADKQCFYSSTPTATGRVRPQLACVPSLFPRPSSLLRVASTTINGGSLGPIDRFGQRWCRGGRAAQQAARDEAHRWGWCIKGEGTHDVVCRGTISALSCMSQPPTAHCPLAAKPDRRLNCHCPLPPFSFPAPLKPCSALLCGLPWPPAPPASTKNGRLPIPRRETTSRVETPRPEPATRHAQTPNQTCCPRRRWVAPTHLASRAQPPNLATAHIYLLSSQPSR